MYNCVESFQDFIDSHIPCILPLSEEQPCVLTPEQVFDEQFAHHIAGINEESLAQLTDEEIDYVINFDVSLLDAVILPSCAFNQSEDTNFTQRNDEAAYYKDKMELYNAEMQRIKHQNEKLSDTLSYLCSEIAKTHNAQLM